LGTELEWEILQWNGMKWKLTMAKFPHTRVICILASWTSSERIFNMAARVLFLPTAGYLTAASSDIVWHFYCSNAKRTYLRTSL